MHDNQIQLFVPTKPIIDNWRDFGDFNNITTSLIITIDQVIQAPHISVTKICLLDRDFKHFSHFRLETSLNAEPRMFVNIPLKTLYTFNNIIIEIKDVGSRRFHKFSKRQRYAASKGRPMPITA